MLVDCPHGLMLLSVVFYHLNVRTACKTLIYYSRLVYVPHALG
uniref:Uncharacterized protein n=1 Tax=Aegilops tauschii subsp. strangulata TaxID=200361 RepID=A0A453BEJ8_AEGTS